MRDLRPAKLDSTRSRCVVAAAFPASMSDDQRSRSLATDCSNCARSLFARAVKSRSASSARVTMSRTARRKPSSSSSVSAVPRSLLAVASDLADDSFKGINVGDGLVHADHEFSQKSLLEFQALGVVPVLPGLLPVGAQFLRQAHQSVLAGVHALAPPGAGSVERPVSTWLSLCGGGDTAGARDNSA